MSGVGVGASHRGGWGVKMRKTLEISVLFATKTDVYAQK